MSLCAVGIILASTLLLYHANARLIVTIFATVTTYSAALFLIYLNAHTFIDTLISYNAKSGTSVQWTGVLLCKVKAAMEVEKSVPSTVQVGFVEGLGE